MLSRAPERRMRAIRLILLLAWLVLILSLFYDPLTPRLTSPDNLASPFHIGATPTIFQGAPLPADPYPITTRVFWTMIVPIIPIALMLFGHETWRRICPISFVSQIPHMLGWQRRVKTLNRSGGRVDHVLALIPSESWMRRNHYDVQFWLLALGVLGRILFYNSDRLALAKASEHSSCNRSRRPFAHGPRTARSRSPSRSYIEHMSADQSHGAAPGAVTPVTGRTDGKDDTRK